MTTPNGLGEQGAQLWGDLTSALDLRGDELTALEQACRTVDELERIRAALAAASSLTVPGSEGQPRPHPLLREAREHRVVLAKLLACIDIPEAEEHQAPTNHRQAGALARWDEYRRRRGTS